MLFPGEYAHVHLESAQGDRDQCRTYCCKEDSRDTTASFGFVEWGDFNKCPSRGGQGARNDLYDAAKRIQSGGQLTDVAMEFPDVYVKYFKGFSALQSVVFSGKRTREADGGFPGVNVYWYYGNTGTGKTQKVFEEIGDQDYFTKSPGNKWFDGYIGQQIVLFDDFRASWFPFSFLLRVLDRYPLLLETKGNTVHWRPRTIYITAPQRPEHTYFRLAPDDGRIEQLTRRITEVRLFGAEPEVPSSVPGFTPGS